MSLEIRQSNQQTDRPPPRAGRNYSWTPPNHLKHWFSAEYLRRCEDALRQLAAEHDANLTPLDGDQTGNAFALRSLSRRAPLWLRLYQSFLIFLALIGAAHAGYLVWQAGGFH